MPTIAEEWPWAYAVHNSCRKDYCHYCLRRCGYALECSSCEFAVYCNDHCQAKAWETHRPECIFITRCPDSVPCGMVRLFSRIVVKLNNGGENEGSWFKTDYSSYERRLFKNLMSHQTRLFLESKRIREFAECCYALRSFMHSENIPFSSGLMEIFGKIVVNAFSILNDDLNPIGIGVYLNLSQLDHACDAENVVMFDGARALLNCLNPDHVDTNSDLRTHTISYDSVICETESRRRTLQSRYYFTCRCRRCLDLDLDAIATSSKCTDPDCNGHVLLDVETGGGKCDGCSKTVDDLWPSVNLMLRVEKQNDALEERVPEEMNILSWRFIRSYFLLTLLLFSSAALFALNISLTALFSRNEKYYSTAAELLRQEANLLHPYNVHLIRTKFFLAHAAMELSRYDEALDLYQQLLPCLKFYVHANHPTIAVNKIGVGNLLKRKKKWIEAKQNFTEVMKLTDLLLISICSALTFHYGRPAECEERWEPYGWITISYLTSCVTFVPNDQIDHCAQEASKQQLIYGQKYTVECIDKYCDDNFPAGYFWSWIPDEPQEKFLLDTFVHEWSETMHGAAFICTTSADNNTHADPCVTIRSNRSVTIQGNDPTTYDSCNATREVPDASDYKRRSCAMLSSHFFQKDVDKHYVCLTLDAQRSLLQFTTTHYCNKAPYRYFTCGHEGEFPCERIRTLACNFNKDLKHCVSYYYTKAPPDREKYQRCQFDYGPRCNCSCSNNYSQWTSWSSTCKPSSRMRIAPFLQPNGQLEPVNCSFENMGECCVQTEINPSSELEDCTNYIYGTNISFVKYNCSEPFGTRIVDEKGHFKCQCTGGYEGMFCENPPSICLSKPCKNGGACSSDGDRYLCNCMPGFKGFQCEETYETCDKGQKCENGGKCTKSQETYACNCTSNYTGVHCEYEVQYCENDTCLPNGKCQNVTTLRTYRCHCGKSHTGRRCEYAVEYCKPESCSGHGICYNLSPGNIKCLCYIGYGGPFCGLNLYVLGAPFCLCAVFLIALLLLRRCRKKHAMMTKTTKATRSRRLSADGPRRKSSGKPLQEVAKKPPSHDYVLPTFTEDSNAGKTPGKAAAALILKTWASHWNAHCRTMGSASILTFQWPHAREAEIEVMKLADLLFISIYNALILDYGSALECPATWGPHGWTTLKYLTSCVTLVPLSKVAHCEPETASNSFLHGQKYLTECIDKYCDDNFPAGYFWTWIPNEAEETTALSSTSVDWKGVLHGANYICMKPADNDKNRFPCVTERSNRSLRIQGNDPRAYEGCYGLKSLRNSYSPMKRSCHELYLFFLRTDLNKQYVCVVLRGEHNRLYFSHSYFCDRLRYDFFSCGHEGVFPCERIRTLGCNFNKDLKHCVSYYYAKAPPDREKYQRCQFDYGSRCNCSCSNNYSQWTSWSGTCKPSSRMRIAPFLQPNGQLEPVNCSFENMGECCVQTELNPSAELEDCTNYIYGTNISLVKYNCSEPFGTRIVDEKGHFKCQCTGGYEGIFCENPPSICLSKPCKNGGACSSDGDRYLCNCMPGFKGFECEEPYETCDKGHSCQNKGVCRRSRGRYICNCVSGYTGVYCEYETGYCGSDTCLPNGECQNITTIGTFRCHCKTPYQGRRCEYAVEYCKADSCSGHGYCRNLTSGKTKCVCYTGYVGEFCDFNLYVVVLPVCICGAVLGGLPMLQKRHRKKSMPRRKSLRSPHSPRSSDGQSKSATRSKPAEEERKKAAKHDYVLPVFSVESVAHTYSGKATGALILSAYAPHWNCELEKRTFYFQWPHVREAEVKAIRMSSELGSIWMDDIQIFDKLCHLSPAVVEHCSHDNPKEKFRMGQKYWTECIDKYCDDNFPFGYYWTWMPDQAEEKRVIHSIRHGWGEILHGASLICTTSGDDTNRHPCVTERSNRSLSIQGNKPEVYDGCYGIPRTDDSYDFHIRSCRGCRSFFLRDDVDKHYVCLILSRSPDRLHFTFAHHCTAMTHTFASCGHEGVFPCDRNRTLGCNFNKDLKHCVSYYYTKAPPDRENTCKPSSRMRIAPFLQANDQLEPVNCSFENMGECCVQTEVNPSAELEDCTDYVYGTNISLVKYNCSEPFGTRIVDEKGHFKCQCTGGYEGMFCENPPPICLSKPCKNGGTCSSDGRYHLCDCLPGFKRFECHQSFQTCDKGQKCENGGECMKSQESYTFANVSRPTQESTANMNLSIVKAIIARRMVNVRTSLPSARLGATATRPTQVVVASMLRHIPVTAVAYCKPNSCGGHVICQNLTSGKTKCVCYTGYVGEFCHFSLYATVLPGCIGAAVLGALLILRKRRRKDGAATKSAMTRRRSTLLSLSFNVPAKLTAASKTPQERKKKPTGADYVLPVFNASSSTRTSSGKAKVTLIIRISTRLLICCECCRIERSYGDLSSWDKQEIKTSNDTMLAFLRLSFYESAPTVCSSCIAMVRVDFAEEGLLIK
ncbi:hypothetical protein M514_07666, partial [Trichuris suis]